MNKPGKRQDYYPGNTFPWSRRLWRPDIQYEGWTLHIIPAKSFLIAHLQTHCAHPAIAKKYISCLNTEKCGDKTILPVYYIITMLVNRELCGNIGIVLEKCICTGIKSDK